MDDFPAPNIGTQEHRVGHFLDQEAYERFAAAYRRAADRLPRSTPVTAETSKGHVHGYRYDGTGAPLVLLPGRNASAPMWAPTLPALLGDRAVIALDAIGEAGRSSQTAPLDGPEDQATWVAQALERLDLGRVHLVGQSLGGHTAMQVALHRPEVLASVTVLDPPATFAGLNTRFIVAGITASLPVVPQAVRRRLLGWIAGDGPEGWEMLEELGFTALETFRVRQPPPSRPSTEDLASLGLPLLAVLAGRSRVHDAGRAAAQARLVPGSRVESWPDAGHGLHAEFPDRLAALVREFTRAVDGSPG